MIYHDDFTLSTTFLEQLSTQGLDAFQHCFRY